MKVNDLFKIVTIILCSVLLYACSNDNGMGIQDETLYEVPAIHGTFQLVDQDGNFIDSSYLFCVNTTEDAASDYFPYVYIYDPANSINEYGEYEMTDDKEFTFTTEHYANGTGKYENGILSISYGDQTYTLARKSKVLLTIANSD